jgi:hypothetical protein
LKKLEPFKSKDKEELLQDPYLQDIIERNLEVTAQSVIDIANRIISIKDDGRFYFINFHPLGFAFNYDPTGRASRGLSYAVLLRAQHPAQGGIASPLSALHMKASELPAHEDFLNSAT